MKSEKAQIRTRFAPSPTGFMHVGGVRTALFAWLLAKQNNGKFILRIEDTDQSREVKGSTEHIIKTLNKLGLSYDEGPDTQNQDYGPYIQSERLARYQEWAQKLIDSGRAYADPYTQEELEVFRQEAKLQKKPFLYRNHRPENPPKWDGKTALRFKSDPKDYEWDDLVMGKLSAGKEAIDDFILIKADGYPTYNFAHIVDDADMQITHVIRGQEFIASQPNFLNLYDALNLSHPKFATLPHILAPSGQKKLSKRDNAKDILDYINEGYLSSALINFIASMGWNDGTTQEVYTVQQLIDKFSLERVGRSGARFDEKRLNWINGQHIKELSTGQLAKLAEGYWPQTAKNASQQKKDEILKLAKERLKTLKDLPLLTEFFFIEPEIDWQQINNNKQLKKLTKEDINQLLEKTIKKLEGSTFKPEPIQAALNELLDETGTKPATLFGLIRTCLTWTAFSPQLNDSIAILGQEETVKRLKKAIAYTP